MRTLSYQHASEVIRLHYENAGFEVGPYVPGSAVAAELKSDVSEHRLGALCAFTDEIIFLLRYVSYYFISDIVSEQRSPASITFLRLTTSALSTLSSIRLLCSRGFDTNARIHLRALYENSLLWSRFIYDNDALTEFARTESPLQANRYWHRILSKGKTERYLQERIAELDLIWLGDISDGRFIEEIKAIIGLTSHPSNIAASFDLQHEWDRDTGCKGITVREMPNSAHFTLSSALFLATLPFGFAPAANYGLTTSDVFRDIMVPPHRNADSWDAYCTEIRSMILRLYMASIRFSEELRAD